MGLYQPEKQRVQEIREMKRSVRHEKARKRKEKREKYKKMYKEELAKERAKLQAQKEKDIEVFKTKLAIEKAQKRARARVRPFAPRRGLKAPSKAELDTLKKAGFKGAKFITKYGKVGLRTLDKMFGDKPTPKKRSPKRKTTKRKYKKKTTKRKGKTYYCRKCRKRHSYSSKVGRKHRMLI